MAPAASMRIVGDELTRTLNRLRGLLQTQPASRRAAQPETALDMPELAIASA
jgi:hypothetical protein